MCGTPVAALDRGAVRELVEEGRTGRAYASLDALARGLGRRAGPRPPPRCARARWHDSGRSGWWTRTSTCTGGSSRRTARSREPPRPAPPDARSPWWNPGLHRERRGARLTRREGGHIGHVQPWSERSPTNDGVTRDASLPGCGGDSHHGLPGSARSCSGRRGDRQPRRTAVTRPARTPDRGAPGESAACGPPSLLDRLRPPGRRIPRERRVAGVVRGVRGAGLAALSDPRRARTGWWPRPPAGSPPPAGGARRRAAGRVPRARHHPRPPARPRGRDAPLDAPGTARGRHPGRDCAHRPGRRDHFRRGRSVLAPGPHRGARPDDRGGCRPGPAGAGVVPRDRAARRDAGGRRPRRPGERRARAAAPVRAVHPRRRRPRRVRGRRAAPDAGRACARPCRAEAAGAALPPQPVRRLRAGLRRRGRRASPARDRALPAIRDRRAGRHDRRSAGRGRWRQQRVREGAPDRDPSCRSHFSTGCGARSAGPGCS